MAVAILKCVIKKLPIRAHFFPRCLPCQMLRFRLDSLIPAHFIMEFSVNTRDDCVGRSQKSAVSGILRVARLATTTVPCSESLNSPLYFKPSILYTYIQCKLTSLDTLNCPVFSCNP